MRTTFQAAICMALLIIYTSWAYALDGIILNPRGTSINQNILSYKDYDDIRIDSDFDGHVDDWILSKGNFRIHVTYKNSKLNTIEIKKFMGPNVAIKRFQNIGGKTILVQNEVRPQLIMHGEADDIHCSKSSPLLETKVSNFGSDISAILARPEVNSNPKTCNMEEFQKFSASLADNNQVLSDDVEKIGSCLEKKGELDGVNLHVVSTNYKLIVKKISEGKSSDVFSCEKASGSELRGSATEDGKFKFLIPANGKDPFATDSALELLTVHEILHASGVVSEKNARDLAEECLTGHVITKTEGGNHAAVPNVPKVMMVADAESKKNGAQTKEAVNSATISNKKSRNVAGSESSLGDGLNIKSEIANAESIVPSSEKLAATSTNKSPEGKEQALRSSVAESAPVFKMANQVMGASSTQALADSSDSSSSSSSSYYPSSSSEVGSSGSSRSSSSKSTGERYQSRYGRYQSKGVGSDEYVAEEVDLTKNVDAQTARNQQNRRQPASRSYQSDTQAYVPNSETSTSSSRGPASVGSEVAKGKRGPASAGGGDMAAVGGATGSGSVNLDTSSSGGSGGGSTTSNNRNAKARSASASRAPASANQGSPAQRRELMDNLKDDNYVLMKRKLREQSYQDELSANGITVMDSYGGRWGASQGTVIYLDNGDRFVRQR